MHIDRRELLRIFATTGLVATTCPMSTLAADNSGVRPAPMMPKPNFIETNGINMAVYEKGEGPAVVFSHGFPELAFSWRNQIDPVSAAGYHVLAPDQRGYGMTGGPEDPSQYDIQYICDDLAGLLDAKGIDKAVFCGHDWGGYIVWVMAMLHPDRCLGIIGLNTPSWRPPELPPVEKVEPPLITRTSNYYIATFMPPGQAEAVLEADVRHTFDFLLSRGGIWDKNEFPKYPAESPERQMDLLALIQRGELTGTPFMPEDVMQYFTETFEATGFTGGLNWYRSIPRIEPIMTDAARRIDVPSLYIGAEHDVILPPSSADGMEDFIGDLEKYTVMDCGHWTQQEKPQEVNRVIIDWLNRKIA